MDISPCEIQTEFAILTNPKNLTHSRASLDLRIATWHGITFLLCMLVAAFDNSFECNIKIDSLVTLTEKFMYKKRKRQRTKEKTPRTLYRKRQGVSSGFQGSTKT